MSHISLYLSCVTPCASRCVLGVLVAEDVETEELVAGTLWELLALVLDGSMALVDRMEPVLGVRKSGEVSGIVFLLLWAAWASSSFDSNADGLGVVSDEWCSDVPLISKSGWYLMCRKGGNLRSAFE